MNIEVAGFVEVDASLFEPSVLEDGLRRFLEGPAPVVYCGRADEVLGKVARISGKGDRIEIEATLDPQQPGTVLADAFNKVASGTIKGLAMLGGFARNAAEVDFFSIAPLTPVPGTGFLTSVSA